MEFDGTERDGETAVRMSSAREQVKPLFEETFNGAAEKRLGLSRYIPLPAAEPVTRKTPRERIEEEIDEKNLPSFGWNTYPMYAALRVIAAADAREDALRKEVECKALQIRTLCDDWAEDHTALQAIAVKAGASKEKTVGDSYGVPGIVDLAEMALAAADAREDAMRKENRKLNNHVSNLKLGEQMAEVMYRKASEEAADLRAQLAAANEEVYTLRQESLQNYERNAINYARAENAEKETGRLRIDRDNMRTERDEMRELCSEYEKETARLTAHEYRERLDRMVAALVGIHNDGGDQCYDFKIAVADGTKILDAIDAHMAQKREG